MKAQATTLAIVTSLLVAGCAAQSQGIAADPVVSEGPTPATAAASPPAIIAYKLTAAEEKLDCPRLTGQMRVRIAQMRAEMARRQGTAVSRSAQAAVTPVFGGTRRGIDPDADIKLDRAKLDAFNRRLAEKKCKTLDIDAELRGEPPAAAPPQVKRS